MSRSEGSAKATESCRPTFSSGTALAFRQKAHGARSSSRSETGKSEAKVIGAIP